MPTIAPASGAAASIASQRIARARSPDWRSTNPTVFRPSAKSCATTATKTSSPVSVESPKASPIPRPSMKLCNERPAAPSAPTLAWAWICASSSRWWSTSARSAQKKKTKPAPTSVPTRCGSSTASIASGRTSKSATATTMPPVSAIAVVSSRAIRSATAPPASVDSTVTPASGIAIQFTPSATFRSRPAKPGSAKGAPST